MDKNDRYDSLIKFYSEKYGLDWKLVKAQVKAESNFNPAAKSPVGAMGLMQFMKPTWEQIDDKDGIPALDSPYNPEENIEAGCRYMSFLYNKFPEIPDQVERYKFALASYNAGRGNINEMLIHAREATNLPGPYSEWKEAGQPPGPWQRWDFAKRLLGIITGEHARETISYVKKVVG